MAAPVNFLQYFRAIHSMNRYSPVTLPKDTIYNILYEMVGNQMPQVQEHAQANGYPNTVQGAKDFLRNRLDNFMVNYTGAKRSKKRSRKRKTRSKKNSRKKRRTRK